MQETLVGHLSESLGEENARNLIASYQKLIAAHQVCDYSEALKEAGRFVEYTLITLKYLQSGRQVKEIPNVKQAVDALAKDKTISEQIRSIIPQVAYSTIYRIRSKRDGMHVKEAAATYIDMMLLVNASSWIIAEFYRQYATAKTGHFIEFTQMLMRATLPFIQNIHGESLVISEMPPKYEILLLLANQNPDGMNRTEIGAAAKCSPASVTRILKACLKDRSVHKTKDGQYCITARGESELKNWAMQINQLKVA